jgi:hypothetical protein
MHYEDSFECQSVAALRLDERDELFPSRAIAEPDAKLIT